MLWLTTGSSKSWKKKDYAKLSSYENNVLTYCLWTVSNQFLFTGVCTKQLKSNLYCTSLIYSGINIINEQVLKSLTGLFCFKMICLFSGLVDIFSFSKRALKWKVLGVRMQLWQPSVHVEPVSFQPLSACCVHFFSWCLYFWTLSAVPHVTCIIFVFNYWMLLNNKVLWYPWIVCMTYRLVVLPCSGVRQMHTPRSCLHACQGPGFHLETEGWLTCHQHILIFHLPCSEGMFSLSVFLAAFGVLSCDNICISPGTVPCWTPPATSTPHFIRQILSGILRWFK